SMPIDLRKLQIFAAVVEDGSMSGAARRLNIAQSALSRHVQELELAVGASLLERSPAGVSPTPLGKRVLRHAHAVLNAMQAMQRELKTAAGEKTSISLGLTSSVARFLSEILRHRLAQKLRLTRISVTEGPSEHLRSLVSAGRLDLAIVTNFSAAK